MDNTFEVCGNTGLILLKGELMSAMDLNDAIWKVNGKITECDKCASNMTCYGKGKLIAFTIGSDRATVIDYNFDGAHATLKSGETCPRKINNA